MRPLECDIWRLDTGEHLFVSRVLAWDDGSFTVTWGGETQDFASWPPPGAEKVGRYVATTHGEFPLRAPDYVW